MTHVSRPLIGLLLATVVFFALWMVALKPHGSSGSASGSENQGLGQYQTDINAAHKAVQTANGASARARRGAEHADDDEPARAARATAPAARRRRHARRRRTGDGAGERDGAARPAAAPRPVARPAAIPKPAASRLASVEQALRSHRVLALLFYNPGAPDDRAIHQELAGITTHRGRVFKLAIPLGEISRYTSITEELPVNLSPTLVLVAPDRQTDEIVGYADPFEISQRIEDALALR